MPMAPTLIAPHDKKHIAIIHCDSKSQLPHFKKNGFCNLDISQLNEIAICGTRANAEKFEVRIHRPLLDSNDYPDLSKTDAVIIPGSVHTPTAANIKNNRWMRELFAFIHKVHEKKILLFGSCFGFQAIAAAFKVPSVPMRSGIEIGFYPVELTMAGKHDPIFKNVDEKFSVAYSHGYNVPDLPTGGLLLVKSERHPIQGFKMGHTTYAFQFHPDFNTEQLLRLPFARRTNLQELSKYSFGAPDKGANNQRVLQNFLDLVQETTNMFSRAGIAALDNTRH